MPCLIMVYRAPARVQVTYSILRELGGKLPELRGHELFAVAQGAKDTVGAILPEVRCTAVLYIRLLQDAHIHHVEALKALQARVHVLLCEEGAVPATRLSNTQAGGHWLEEATYLPVSGIFFQAVIFCAFFLCLGA